MTTSAARASFTSPSRRPAIPDPCRYLKEGECRNRLALPVYGKRPSDGVCARCEHRNGLRGLGDALAWILSWTPARIIQRTGCKGCKRRQEAMNGQPSRPCRSCAEKKVEGG